jgi:hypothetical protein
MGTAFRWTKKRRVTASFEHETGQNCAVVISPNPDQMRPTALLLFLLRIPAHAPGLRLLPCSGGARNGHYRYGCVDGDVYFSIPTIVP